MQGRLSAPVGGRIQAFPWTSWREEFVTAHALGFTLMEWTLDHERLAENPLLTETGRREVQALAERWQIRIESLTADFVMQAPFFKVEGLERQARLDDLRAVVEASAAARVGLLVIPLVDEGRLEDERQEEALVRGLETLAADLRDACLRVAFESDYSPEAAAALLRRFPDNLYGLNYDTGNSAALGYDPDEEVRALGGRIFNVHIKDRHRRGPSVPLGTGDAALPTVIRLLCKVGYVGNFILQTARAVDGDHAGALRRARDLVLSWLELAG